jgi:SAM-dependent methyltransferase
MATKSCPNCGTPDSQTFHRISGVPVNSCLLFTDRGRAESLAQGDIDLAFCPRCAFIFNAAWERGTTTYTDLYEETQVFSPTYSAFQRELAEGLIRRYGLFGKEIVEIGCGKGAFLSLLCELGGNSGVGYDPSFVPERNTAGTANVTFRREYFSESTDQPAADLVCCRMTLEHISDTRRFVQAVRRIASPERGTIVFFQVPDVRRILAEGAFWDVYYEHCSYFSPTSLGYLFRLAGFDILRITGGFDDQYVTIEARPTERAGSPDAPAEHEEVEDLAGAVAAYSAAAARCAADWAARIHAAARAGARVVLWGSGSKAVAFLSAVSAGQEIQHLVDVNPHRWGKFVPGTGKQIVSPRDLSRYRPDLVIAMNPIYRREIAEDLDRYGCRDALLCALGDIPVQPVPATALTASGVVT